MPNWWHGVYLPIKDRVPTTTVCGPEAGPWTDDWDKVTCPDCLRIRKERTTRGPSMSTTPVRLPCCGALLRVAVQESKVKVLDGRVLVEFDPQTAAHVCARPKAPRDRRALTHEREDCWCGMPHRREDFL